MKDFLKVTRYILPYKGYALLNILFNILSAVFSLCSFTMVIPFLGILFNTQEPVREMVEMSLTDIESMKHNFYYWLTSIIDSQGKFQALITIAIIVVIATFFKTATMYLANHFMVPIRNGVVKDIRNSLFNRTLSLPIAYFSDEHKGNIIARMTSDVQEIEWGIMSSLEMIFRDPVKIIIYLVSMIIISWELTVFAFILLPIVGLLIGKTGRSLRKTSMAGQEKMGSLLSQIEEMIGGLRVIKAFNAEKHISEKFEKDNEDYTKLMNHINRIRFLASPLSEFLATVAVVIILCFGGTMILASDSTFSSEALIGYLLIFSQLIQPAKSLSTAWFNVKKAMASVDRVNEILDAENQIINTQGDEHIPEFCNEIEFRNVKFSYNADTEVLHGINLTIKKGQTIALVGQSGSGKSTIVDLIPRFYDVTDGEILIDGKNIRDYKLKQLRDLMGYVNQVPILFNDTIYNNITLGQEGISKEDVERAAKIANAYDFIMETEKGFDTNIGDGGCKLSGGQRQRISIARALLKNPPILILDEATSALDTESERLVQEAIEQLMKNRTSIVVAHRLSTIKNADIIIVLNEGQIVETGKHDELIAKQGIYYKLHTLQNS
ncbi:MAG: ABC transporter ATP-binding protein [Bacteroidales bacterium]|nr:ABC transporter ATP-binding protein [Bacteroidales bacterium]